MSARFTQEFMASRLTAFTSQSDVDDLVATLSSAVNAHCILDTERTHTRVYRGGIVSVVLTYLAASEIEAHQIAVTAARAALGWSVEVSHPKRLRAFTH
jgi:hypothetical protein